MEQIKKYRYLALVAIVLAISVFAFTQKREIGKVLGGTTNYDTLQVQNTYATATSTFVGTTTITAALYNNGLGEAVQSGVCSTGTTTVAAFPNPFNATSTFDRFVMRGTGASTSLAFLVGTSSTQYVNYWGVAGIPSPTIVSSSSIPSGQSFYFVDRNAPATSTTAGAIDVTQKFYASDQGIITTFTNATNTRIFVGPTEWVVVQATSSSGGANNTTDLRGVTNVGSGGSSSFSCSYFGKFTR